MAASARFETRSCLTVNGQSPKIKPTHHPAQGDPALKNFY